MYIQSSGSDSCSSDATSSFTEDLLWQQFQVLIFLAVKTAWFIFFPNSSEKTHHFVTLQTARTIFSFLHTFVRDCQHKFKDILITKRKVYNTCSPHFLLEIIICQLPKLLHIHVIFQVQSRKNYFLLKSGNNNIYLFWNNMKGSWIWS